MSTTHFVRLKAASRCRLAPAFLLFLALDACGGGAGGGSSSGYTIGGDLSGLPSGGQEITLLNNGTDALTLVTNGPFTFSHEVPNGGNYNVTIKTQPAGGTCVVSNGSGTHSNANVTVTCSTNTYTVGGNLVGLASGQQVTLQNNGAALLTLTTDGTFSFSTQIPYAGTYSVTVSSQPSQASQQFCTVSNGSGTIYGAVTNVQVTCNTTLILYGFSSANSLTGGNPTGSLIMDAAGNLYGTTEGIVFELSPAVGGGYTGSVLYERPGVSGGVIMDSAGNLYGTSPNVVFKLTPSSGGGYSESDLHAFPGDTADGGGLAGALILDSGGNLYGTASSGGTNLAGIVFELSPSAGGGYNESILHSFTGGGDGANPTAGLVMDSTGNLYGTTTSGGGSGNGAVFELTPSAGGGYTESILHRFSYDGTAPQAGLIMDSAGYLYGTTRLGTVGGIGYGTVFKLSASGSGYTILYSFTGGSDGAQPVARLIMDGAGNLYGTTSLGGSSSNCYNGCGTVFKLSTAGGDHTILHSFTGGSDGANPTAGLIMDSAGNLYGTATNGGGPDFGNVFEILLP